ncbi:hypothetical protein K2173_018104 [Erythroxylum novogranatense]|uniref:Uncharacterized protein n=1 Tax=Erythroxylum novogranatense TaxID=1862640 RepID=A0AAV8U941_9ROSI|nr:hypothetical protein K2173_018104 [Erythroxylum novogranatense]
MDVQTEKNVTRWINYQRSESDDSDYSIGWLEPHGPEFQSDDDTNNSFAVLVPCYGRAHDNVLDNTKNKTFAAITKIPNGYSDVILSPSWLSVKKKRILL